MKIGSKTAISIVLLGVAFLACQASAQVMPGQSPADDLDFTLPPASSAFERLGSLTGGVDNSPAFQTAAPTSIPSEKETTPPMPRELLQPTENVSLSTATSVEDTGEPQKKTQPLIPVGSWVQGVPYIADAATLIFKEGPVRLQGDLVFPEADRVCQMKLTSWDCGQEGKQVLESLVTARTGVSCIVISAFDTGLPIGQCFSGETDLSSSMVRSGMVKARALMYRADMHSAMEAKRGLWTDGL
ncbi:thermonuclease family protein [Thalassospira xianhensis]|uniref:Endonuclease YncB, thermonuclease family n=2 Tax=Thalassospira TaxID=168934 RepID=A0A285TSL1_9PROT|nr:MULTISPECIES: thermonuclease family protein [Thalassospira]RCK07781.1 hypothetical protein TH5_01685 [Thalassospira xianhensis MCCC 1A02616]SOC26907.1 Endonuclease YncB, thermonuclease family [Thalassospira xiamenensis]